jgi:hypothetical protein
MQVPLLRLGSIDAEGQDHENDIRQRRWPCAVYASTTSLLEHFGHAASHWRRCQ